MAYQVQAQEGVGGFENLQDFEIHKVLGNGAFGIVLKVCSIENRRKYAVKLVVNSYSQASNELSHFARIPPHENVVVCYTSWVDNINKREMKNVGIYDLIVDTFRIPRRIRHLSILCIQMELCGQDLRHWLRQRKHVKENKCWRIFRQILNGLQHIHNQGLIHRDLKPENIFFAVNNPVVKIGDFGIAASHEGTAAGRHTQGCGTLLYMAPEQYTRNYGSKVDLFAMGLILFEIYYPPAQEELENSLNDLKHYKDLPEEFQRWPEVSTAILSLLNYNPKRRPSIAKLAKMLSIETVVVCDGCGTRSMEGLRYKCRFCDDFDYCGNCYWSADSHRRMHKFSIINRPRVEILPSGGEDVVHHGVECANCEESPIKGRRYICHSCSDLDFCRNCYVDDDCHRELHNFTVITRCELHNHACKEY